MSRRLQLPRVMLAPMAGYTDAAFRSMCVEHGCPLTFTEVINAQAIVYRSALTWHLAARTSEDGPLMLHLYTSEPAIAAEAVSLLLETNGTYAGVDLNCGCPVRKIMAKGAGAALMASPARIEQVVRSLTAVTDLPVTVKTRIGLAPEQENVLELCRAAEAGGAAAIAIHARYASVHHRGPADWALLRRAKGACSIPVIGNGGIQRPADVPAMLNETGVDAVMIGRAAVGNPWIFEGVHECLAGREPARHSLEEHRAVLLEQLRRQIARKQQEQAIRRRSRLSAEAAGVLHFRAHLVQYLRGFPRHRAVLRRLQHIASIQQVEDAVDWALSSAIDCSPPDRP